MNENKITISRSFSRKLNLGNFQTADFFSSRSMELPIGTSTKEQQEVSDELFSLAQLDTEKSADDYTKMLDKNDGFSIKKLTEIIDEVSIGNPFALDDFEKLSPEEHKIIQAVKRAYQRSPLKKSKERPDPRNEPTKKS